MRDQAIFRVAYHRGLRASEVGMLDLADYCDKTGRLYVRRLQRSYSGEYLLGRSEREALKLWIQKRGRAPGALFLSRNHRGISRWALDKLMKKYCALAKIPNQKAHMRALKPVRGNSPKGFLIPDRESRNGPERMPGESESAHSAFCIYRDLGFRRSLNAAWQAHLAKHAATTTGRRCPGQWQLWSRRFAWVKRAQVHDVDIARRRMRDAIQAARDDAE